MTNLTSPGLNPCLKLKKWDFTGIMWIQHPVWTGRRSGPGTHYLQKHCATLAVNTAPRVTETAEVTRGDTVRCVDSTKQHGQRESNWKINLTLCFPVSWITASTQKHTLCLQPVSHSAYCRSTSAFLLVTSSKVLLLLGCLVPFSHFPSLPPPSFFIAVFFRLRLTSLRVDSHTCWWCSCSGPALSSCQQPPDEGRHSPAPGRPPAPRSGSPSAAGRPVSASPPRCSWLAGSSTFHPVTGGGVVCWGVWGGKWGEESTKKREWNETGQLCDERERRKGRREMVAIAQ